MRLLLVEDYEFFGSQLKTALELAGYACDWETHGRDGARAIEANAYDALLLNVGLPGLSGKELLALARAKSATVPVIMLTAQLWDESQAYLAAGANAYFTKPFDIPDLVRTIESLVAHDKQVA